MNNNRGGIGRFIVVGLILVVLFFVVSKVGVDSITTKANKSLDSALSKGEDSINNFANKDDIDIDYDSDRPYKEYNDKILESLKNNISDYETDRPGYSLKDFLKDGKYYSVNDDYAKNWQDFDNKECNTYKAALISLGEDVKVDDDCTIKEGSWTDQYVKDHKDNKTTSSTSSTTQSSTEKKDNKPYSGYVVDSVVSLKNIWDSGYGTTDMSQRFGSANDRINMMITTKENNKKKGNSTIDQWTPEKDSPHYCDYADRYGLVKKNYSLPVTQKEYDTIKNIYDSCNG